MNYQKVYDQIVDRARKENRQKLKGGTYYEAHHIVPKCLGGEGKTSQWKTHPNIILLTAREHFICHWLLVRAYPNEPKLVFAFWGMCNLKNREQGGRYTPSSRTFSEVRELHSKNISKNQIDLYSTDKGKKIKTQSGENLKRFNQTTEGRETKARQLATRNAYNQTDEGRRSITRQVESCKAFYKTPEGVESLKRKGESLKAFNSTEEGVAVRKLIAIKHFKPVLQFDKRGTLIKEWPSLKEAGEHVGISVSVISSCLTGRQRTAGGFIWKYKK